MDKVLVFTHRETLFCMLMYADLVLDIIYVQYFGVYFLRRSTLSTHSPPKKFKHVKVFQLSPRRVARL